jgi:hypothetical protein
LLDSNPIHVSLPTHGNENINDQNGVKVERHTIKIDVQISEDTHRPIRMGLRKYIEKMPGIVKWALNNPFLFSLSLMIPKEESSLGVRR